MELDAGCFHTSGCLDGLDLALITQGCDPQLVIAKGTNPKRT